MTRIKVMFGIFIKQNSDQFHFLNENLESFPLPTELQSEGCEPGMCKMKHGIQEENTGISMFIYIILLHFFFCIFL